MNIEAEAAQSANLSEDERVRHAGIPAGDIGDARQALHFRNLFAAARLWGHDRVELEHVSFGSVLGPDRKPLLVLSHEGEGRVALLLSDQLWLWARGFEGGGPHLDLLRRLSHWLMKEPDLEEEALRLGVSGHNLAVRRQTMADTVAEVTLTSPSGATRTLALDPTQPGVWEKSVAANELGLWRATDGKLTAEQLDTALDVLAMTATSRGERPEIAR